MGDETGRALESSGAGGVATVLMAVEDLVDQGLLSLDWFDSAACTFWMAQPGKTGVWLDMDGAILQGGGPWLEKELAGMGVGIYAKMLVIVEHRMLALIVVDKRHAKRVRAWLSKKKLLVQ